MAHGENIGQPWLHKGVKCAKCEVTPISGYRYKCKKKDYDLCQACFRREIPDPKIKYLKIERSKTTGPYQVHFIECAECGVAPIKGKRYRHKTQEECDLCEACFVRATNPSNRRAQPESDYELFEELVVNSVCTKYDQVFHFDKRCDECLVSPICGPTFTSIKNPDYDLCVFCHDEKLQSDSIRSGDFMSREKPDVSAVYHLNIICCLHCGMTPIKGPAFRHRRDPNKTLCLVCHYNVQKEKQRYFTRIDPPRQAEKGPTFILKPKASAQVQASAAKTPASNTSTEVSITEVDSNTPDTKSKSDSVPRTSSTTNLSTTPDTHDGGVVSRGNGSRNNLSSNGTNSTGTPDSNGGGMASRGYGVRSILKTSGTNPTAPDSYEGGVTTRGNGFRSNLKSSGKNSTTTPDSNEEGGMALRGYGARSNTNSNGTTPVVPSLAPAPKITNKTGVESKTPTPPLYTAGLRTSRAPSPSPRPPSPPSTQPGKPQQSSLKYTSSSPATPKPILKVTFAEPEQQPPPAVKFSPSLQPPPAQQAELNQSSPPQSHQKVNPPPPAQNSVPPYQQRGFTQPAAAQQLASAVGPSSNSVYPPSSQSQNSVYPPSSQSQNSVYPPSSQSQNSVYPPSSQSQLGTAVPPPQVPNYMPGAAPNFPASAADCLAAMTAAQNNSAHQAIAMLNAIRIEKERSNLALLQQILQRTQAQQGVDYSALLGNTVGGLDYGALLNTGGGNVDYSAVLPGGGGSGMDISTLLAAAGGGNTDLAALLAGQNNLGGLGGGLNNLGALGLGG